MKQEEMTNIPEDRIPVIVGIGEIVDRPKEITEGLEPLDLLEQALRRAEADAGAMLLGEVQSLDVVNFLSWRYRDPEKLLAQRLGITPSHCYYGPVGGESPIRYIHEAAKRIARGECSVAAVCGAEAQSTATKAERAGAKLPWTPFAHDVEEPKRGAAFQKPLAVKLGVFRPVTVYPFYEAASSAHWGQTPREAMAESGTLWSRYSEAAAQNPNAWLKRRYAPDEITTPTADNRLIAWPYNKLMVANPSVNMGGALLLTSLARARAAGIAEDRLVYPLGGASAEEPRDYLLRDQFYESHPQNAVLKAAVDLAGGDGTAFEAIELYSCFPCVPKMARRTLGLFRRRAADRDRRPHLLRRAAQHLHDACGLRDGAAPARWRQARPALRPGRLRHQASCAGGFEGAAARGAGAGDERARRGRPQQARGAEFRRGSLGQGQGRELYGALRPRRGCRARCGDAAHGR
ncbi:acetyl-CoA acetyltransferase [Bradyrhizobium japonicum]